MEKEKYIHIHETPSHEAHSDQIPKSEEQQIQAYLAIMLMHKATPRAKCPKISTHQDLCIKLCENITALFSNESQQESSLIEVTRDHSFISILGLLNEYVLSEMKVIYLIFKQICKAKRQGSYQVSRFLDEHIKEILSSLMSNFIDIRDNFIIVYVGKMLRKLIICDNILLKQMIELGLIESLHNNSRSDNFILTQECLKVISFVFQSPKLIRKDVIDVLREDHFVQSVMFINSLMSVEVDSNGNDKFYYLKRETLRLLDYILSNHSYELFNEHILNNIEMLKAIMMLLNSNSNKIMKQAIKILGYFINDLEYKDNKIKHLLFDNKENFEHFFTNHTNDREIDEKKNRILYELERLGNILDK